MPDNKPAESNPDNNTAAYLVAREGNTLGEVHVLTPGQATTIGRAPTNRIVLDDEICSRNHCEIFQSQSVWTLRDLGSRNGTTVDGARVAGDWELQDGEVIRIGGCFLQFTYSVSRAERKEGDQRGLESDTETAIDGEHEQSQQEFEPSIIHRTRRSRYQKGGPAESISPERTSQELARLYRLGMEMGAAGSRRELSDVILDGLFTATSADIGAVLLLPTPTSAFADLDELQVIAYRSAAEVTYEKVSDYVSRMVLEEREAILTSDILDDQRLSSRDSLGEIHARSVLCAPIHKGGTVHGLLHLYSTNPDNPLEPDDLEFTLAVADQLAVALQNLNERAVLADKWARAEGENRTLRQQLQIETQLVGESPSVQQLRGEIARIAPSGATVLVRGESGVGKELVARAIHFQSDRRNHPLVCMNCAALSESLLESELFGHEKGSFTGATERKFGKFEQANTGTLFLDEVGEMSLAIQAKFLRVLEGHPFERVGGDSQISTDVRVVAATNRDLEQDVSNGNFRKDLYFRLHVLEIVVAPLQDHPTDIPLLANYFLKRLARQTNRAVRGFSPQAIEALLAYHWPGNVRELQNVVERAVILCPGELVRVEDIRLSSLERAALDPSKPAEPAGHEYAAVSLDELEQQHILSTLESTDWNKTRAAQVLGIERSTLDRKLKRYKVSRPLR